MSAFLVEGGRRLDGSVRVHGAKNSVLPILAAAFLADGESVIHNCPRLSDVAASLEILRHLGCGVRWEGDTVSVDASAPAGVDVPDALMREMRSSVIFLGALLSRLGEAQLSYPAAVSWVPGPSTCTCPPCAPWGRRSGRSRAACAAGRRSTDCP